MTATWVRSGECCRCGQCCMGDPFNGTMGEPPITGACPLLTLHSGVFTCTGRATSSYYLNACSVWPSHPDQIADKPGCSYRFEKAA